MAAANLKNMDVDELLALRGDVESALRERAEDLTRQIALLGGRGEVKRRGRPPGSGGRVSAMRGTTVPPKYRGPEGETWAGRGATPRWLAALIKDGHSIEEFAIAGKGRKAAAAVAKTVKKGKAAAAKKKVAKKKGRKPVARKSEAEAAAGG